MEYERARSLARKYGISTAEARYVHDSSDALSFSNGKPIVLKVISQKALHKSRNGLVALNLSSKDQIADAFNALSKKAAKFKPYKILAQRMLESGTEIIIGGKVDSQFGKMILLGLGGIYVETFKDFALRLCPITARDAESMIMQLKSAMIVAPDAKSRKELASTLVRASNMFLRSRMTELDLNPLILRDGKYYAVDLRMIE